jgi:hypothetical protein
MSESRFDPNDPRLTAYVLGEFDETERAAVERQLEDCAQSRTAVEEIRSLTGLLSAQLQSEPDSALTEAQRETVVAAAETVAVAGNVTPSRNGHRWALVTVLSTLAAAAGLLIALSPKSSSFTDSADGLSEQLLASNESSEEQRAKDALDGENAILLFGTMGDDGQARIQEGKLAVGETSDSLSVGDLKTKVGAKDTLNCRRELHHKSIRKNSRAQSPSLLPTRSPYNHISFPSMQSLVPSPRTVASRVLGRTSQINHLSAKSWGGRSLRANKFLNTLDQVKSAHVPYPSEPPINWPTRAEWKKLTERRKLWKYITELKKRQGQGGCDPCL